MMTITGDHRRTGEEFVDGVHSLVSGLLELGIQSGDVIAIAAMNSDSYLEWLLAITYIGAIAAPLNYRWSFEEARLAMDTVRPVMLVVDESCKSWALRLGNSSGSCEMPLPRLYTFIGESSSLSTIGSVMIMDLIRRPSQVAAVVGLKWAPRGVAIICFTSGLAKVVLKKGKTQIFHDGSPMVYSGTVDRIIGRPPPKTGGLVLLADGSEKPIGWGLYNSVLMFCVRLMQLEDEAVRNANCALDMEKLLESRFDAAIELHRRMVFLQLIIMCIVSLIVKGIGEFLKEESHSKITE